MLSKTNPFAAVLAATFCFFIAMDAQTSAQTPAAPGAPAMAPGKQRMIIGEASTAFEKKDYTTTVAKLKEVIGTLVIDPKTKINPAYEELYFHLALAHLLGGQFPDAEAAFEKCAQLFPKGEYATRCQLGIGRACILQENDEKKQKAIKALREAAKEPKFRSEAGLWLGQILIEMKQPEEALKVFRSLMGSDVRSNQQTLAAIEVVGLLADLGKEEDLVSYLDRLSHQPGVRDAITFFVNEIIRHGDELVAKSGDESAGSGNYEAALVIYRAVPPLSQILETQNLALAAMRKDQSTLERVINSEKDKPIEQRSNAAELLSNLKPGIELAEAASKVIEGKKDLDSELLMRRGRCLYYLKRYEEALVCFRTLRTKYKSAPDVEHAAYAEIVILSKLKDILELRDKCQQYMNKYPASTHIEQVTALAVDVLVQSHNWKEVRSFCSKLEADFPKSENLETYVFYQAVAFFMEGNFGESTPIFTRFLKDFPTSERVETAMYYMAMSHFLHNDQREAVDACKDYLKKFPDGYYAGDMQYRLSFIDYNDKDVKSEKIIRDLSGFLKKHPKDAAAGSMYCLLADVYKKVKPDPKASEKAQIEESDANEVLACKAYMDAVETESPDDIMQYALDSASAIMQRSNVDVMQRIQHPDDKGEAKDGIDPTEFVRNNKAANWKAIGEMHGKFMKRKPDSQLFLLSARWIARAAAHGKDGYPAAIKVLADVMEMKFGDPTSEQIEYLIDELVETLIAAEKQNMKQVMLAESKELEEKLKGMPAKDAAAARKDAAVAKKKKEIDFSLVNDRLVKELDVVTEKKHNDTTLARKGYASARLAQALKNPSESDRILKGIATTNEANPTALSPTLLSICGYILLNLDHVDGARAMFQRLIERFHDGTFSDAGPVGMGYVALKDGKPEEALKMFDETLTNNNGIFAFKESTLGKLEALIALEKFEEAETFAKQIVSDKSFRGETAAKAYLLRGKSSRRQADKESSQTSDKARSALKEAHAYYQHVYTAFRGYPDLCAEGYWQAIETLKKLGDLDLADETLHAFLGDTKKYLTNGNKEKLKNTQRYKEALNQAK